MDGSLLKKMSTFQAHADPGEPDRHTDQERSTLIKANIAVFHGEPDSPVNLQDDHSEDLEPVLSDYEAGLQDGRAQSEAVFQDTISVMQNVLDTLQAERHNIAREIEQSHLSSLLNCWNAIFPALTENGTAYEIHTIIKNACEATLKGSIRLDVNPDDKKACEQLCRAFVQEIAIQPDPSLAPEQVRVQWQGGGADIDSLSIAKQCQFKLETALQNLTTHNPGEESHE